MRLENQVIVIAAAEAELGWALARVCAEANAIVYLAGRDQQRGGELAQALTSKGMWVKSVYLDAAREESIAAAVELAATQEGRLDALVNCFGLTDEPCGGDLEHTEFNDFMRVLRRTLAGVYLTSKAAVPPMRASGGGVIVNVSAIETEGRAAGGTARAAVQHLTGELARRYAKDGIRCAAVLPGEQDVIGRVIGLIGEKA